LILGIQDQSGSMWTKRIVRGYIHVCQFNIHVEEMPLLFIKTTTQFDQCSLLD
jgi:hypothetical protein